MTPSILASDRTMHKYRYHFSQPHSFFCLLAPQAKKLTYMYLANDIIQNSKKKGPEYGKEFSKVLKKAFSHIGDTCASDNRTIGSLGRILKIWEDRGVYDEKAIVDFRTELQKDPKSVASAPAAEKADKPEKAEKAERAPVNGSEKRSIDKVAEKSRSSDNNNRKKQKTKNSEAVAPKEDKQTTQFVLSPRSAAGMS